MLFFLDSAGNENAIKNIVQSSWTFINDSLSTTLCLQWEPEVIAIAFMYLAGKMSQFQIETFVDVSNKENSGQNWWSQFVEDLGIEVLEGQSRRVLIRLISTRFFFFKFACLFADICHQILDLYVIRKEEQDFLQAIQMKQQQQQYLKQYQQQQMPPLQPGIQEGNEMHHASH